MNKWKYIVWVGGCDDYYVDYEQAKKHYDEWIDKGYDDVILEEIKDETNWGYQPIKSRRSMKTRE